MKVDRYLVASCNLPGLEPWMLIDCLYRQVIATGDNEAELKRQARERTRADNAPIVQRHRR